MNVFLILKGKKKEAGKQAVAYNRISSTSGSYRRKTNMDRYGCIVCRYIYDPVKGDIRQFVHAGKSFLDLPEDWHCPECGVGRESFKKIEKCKAEE